MAAPSKAAVMTPRGIYRDPLAEGQHLILVDYGPHRMYVLEMMYREMGYQPHTMRKIVISWLAICGVLFGAWQAAANMLSPILMFGKPRATASRSMERSTLTLPLALRQ
jgi:hypothetical protein